MARSQSDIVEAGAEIIWVLEQTPFFEPGTAERCLVDMGENYGAETGWCVGDGETLPAAGTFDTSPFSVQRGFDMIVDRETMVILYSTSHGSRDGNENLTGEDILAEVRRHTGR